MGNIQIKVNEKTYLKDPNTSALGRQIVAEGLEMIHALGMEGFTFRKLAQHMGSTESSIYRYFENKHKLLLYLTSWYWCWLEYRMVMSTMNVASAEERLRKAIELTAWEPDLGQRFGDIELHLLARVVISESSKAYLTKQVDNANRDGLYAGYKRFVGRVSEIALEIKPDYRRPHALISTIVEGVHHQKYFAEHLPSLTDFKPGCEGLVEFYHNLALRTLQSNR